MVGQQNSNNTHSLSLCSHTHTHTRTHARTTHARTHTHACTHPPTHPCTHTHAHTHTTKKKTIFEHRSSDQRTYKGRQSLIYKRTFTVAMILSLELLYSVQYVKRRVTLRAPLSVTFLQTLPDLVMPLKGHSLSPRSCPPTRSAPSKRFRY